MAVFAIFIISLIFSVIWSKFKSGRNPPLPPGPPSDPIIGHLRAIPPNNQEQVFHEWAKTYGDVIHLHYLGRSVVVLDSIKAAVDLLDKKGSNYSNRPVFVVFELMGWHPTLTFLNYATKQYRIHRRFFHLYFTRHACRKFQSIQKQEAYVLVNGLMSNPGKHDDLLGRFSVAVIMKIAYGHQITSEDDKFVQISKNIGYAMNNSGPAGNTPVDLFPFLQSFPLWFPGTWYAQYARDWRWAIRELHDVPFKDIEISMANGTAEPSFAASKLEELAQGGLTRGEALDDIQGAAATIYGAGAETTWSTLSLFLLLMVLYPESQKKAQDEIDAVIGSGRLPEFSDRGSLLFVECLLQEMFRFYPILPLGVPHTSREDDVYRGMFIPKGSIVFPNQWAMGRDESTYAEPHKFNPARFLPKPTGNGETYISTAFGFGRRTCPGIHLADASLWIAISSILATLHISKAVGDDGREVTPDFAFDSGFTSHPKPFECVIRPRSQQAESLILQANSTGVASSFVYGCGG